MFLPPFSQGETEDNAEMRFMDVRVRFRIRLCRQHSVLLSAESKTLCFLHWRMRIRFASVSASVCVDSIVSCSQLRARHYVFYTNGCGFGLRPFPHPFV